MPNWVAAHGSHFEVPPFIDFLVKKGVIQDLSYKNDESPAFGLADPYSDHRLILWVGHPLKSWRYYADERFQVQEDDAINFSSDDLETALDYFFKKLRTFGETLPRKGPKEWRPHGRGVFMTEAEMDEFFSDLKDEFYARRYRGT